MDRETIIATRGLGYRIGRQYLLQDINWEIKRGEHWILFGLNGSGKTTLLSILSGFNQQTEGDLSVFGSAYNEENLLRNRRKMGLVSSSYFDAHYHNESVLEIVLSGSLGTLGLDFELADEVVKEAKAHIGSIGLDDKLNQSYGTLSKGERENVLIARALMAKPEILLLDEPCSGLDVLARDQMLGMVENLAHSGQTTIIYVTHYAEEVLPCFEKGALLRQGKMYQQGEREMLFNKKNMGEFLQTDVNVCQDQLGRITIAVQEKKPLACSVRGEGE